MDALRLNLECKSRNWPRPPFQLPNAIPVARLAPVITQPPEKADLDGQTGSHEKQLRGLDRTTSMSGHKVHDAVAANGCNQRCVLSNSRKSWASHVGCLEGIHRFDQAATQRRRSRNKFLRDNPLFGSPYAGGRVTHLMQPMIIASVAAI